MQITINNYRIRRYDSLNLCVEVNKAKTKSKKSIWKERQEGKRPN